MNLFKNNSNKGIWEGGGTDYRVWSLEYRDIKRFETTTQRLHSCICSQIPFIPARKNESSTSARARRWNRSRRKLGGSRRRRRRASIGWGWCHLRVESIYSMVTHRRTVFSHRFRGKHVASKNIVQCRLVFLAVHSLRSLCYLPKTETLSIPKSSCRTSSHL